MKTKARKYYVIKENFRCGQTKREDKLMYIEVIQYKNFASFYEIF